MDGAHGTSADRAARPPQHARGGRLRLAWLCGLCLLAAPGCTALSGYHHDWREATRWCHRPVELTGAWDGHWVSDKSGHRGHLRAIICRTSDGRYYARFHARFFKLLTANYDIPLCVAHEGCRVRFWGSAYLGELAGGTYHCSGYATACEFRACYRSSNDFGRFEMCRVEDSDCGCCPAPVCCAPACGQGGGGCGAAGDCCAAEDCSPAAGDCCAAGEDPMPAAGDDDRTHDEADDDTGD